jgi:hypothetical protein
MPARDFVDRHIARAEQIIEDQQLELWKPRLKGHDTKLLERTIEVFQDNLQAMYEHRSIIATTNQQIDQGLIYRVPAGRVTRDSASAQTSP